MCFRRYCTSNKDFIQHSEYIHEKFVKKGYSDTQIDSEIQRMLTIPRNQCLDTRVQDNGGEDRQWSFISDFNCQYRDIENIFSRHWHVLMMDRVLKPILPQKPSFIYRKAPVLLIM